MQSNAELAATIASRLAIVRAKRPETQRELSEKTGVTLSVLNTALQGKSVPQTDALILLGRYYNVSVDWLVGETDNPQRARAKAKAAS